MDKKENYVVTNNDEWKNLWNEFQSNIYIKSDLPYINFTQNIVIAVFQDKCLSGSYSIEVVKVVENKDNIEVFV